MSQVIGEAAGKVWEYLCSNGAASASMISRQTGLTRDLTQRAIGWLAREDKLAIEKVKRTEKVRLCSDPAADSGPAAAPA